MKCSNCPYSEEDFRRRMYWYEKIVQEKGIPNNIYHYLKPEDAPDEFEQLLWCDKVGGRIYWFGRCEDYNSLYASNRSNKSKHKKRNKRERNQKYNAHLKDLCESNLNSFFPPVIYTDKIWIEGYGYVDNPEPYYKRLYRGQRSKYLKRISHKKIRKYNGMIPNGNWFHRISDFWYDMY